MSAREPLKWTMRQVFEFAVPANYSHLLDLLRAEIRSEVLDEAADFVCDAHFRDGLSVQEIGTALRLMADTSTPTSREEQQ